MLSKLFKHEFKTNFRFMGVVYLIGLAVIGISIGLFALDNAFNFSFISLKEWSLFSLGIAMFGGIIGTFIFLALRFPLHVYKNEGYLTMTLPVTHMQILISKLVTAVVYSLGAIIIFMMQLGTFLLFFRWHFGGDLWTHVSELVSAAFKSKEFMVMLIFAGFAGFLQLVNFYCMVYMASTIAATSIFKKYSMGMAFLVYIGLNITVNMITGILTMFIPIGINIDGENTGIVFRNMLATLTQQDVNIVGIGTLFFYIVSIPCLLYITGRIMKKRITVN